MKVSKPKTTRSAFTAQKATTGDDADKPAAAELNKSSEKTKKKKGSTKRKRTNDSNPRINKSNLPASSASNVAAAATTSSSGASTENQSKKPRRHCTACGVDGHNFSKCYLVIEEPSKDLVNRETFDNNMKVPSFRK